MSRSHRRKYTEKGHLGAFAAAVDGPAPRFSTAFGNALMSAMLECTRTGPHRMFSAHPFPTDNSDSSKRSCSHIMCCDVL